MKTACQLDKSIDQLCISVIGKQDIMLLFRMINKDNISLEVNCANTSFPIMEMTRAIGFDIR